MKSAKCSALSMIIIKILQALAKQFRQVSITSNSLYPFASEPPAPAACFSHPETHGVSCLIGLIINQLLVSPVLCGGTEGPDIVHIAKTYLWARPDSKLCLLPAQTAPIMDPNAVMVR